MIHISGTNEHLLLVELNARPHTYIHTHMQHKQGQGQGQGQVTIIRKVCICICICIICMFEKKGSNDVCGVIVILTSDHLLYIAYLGYFLYI
jgi:hypothetical protein